MRYITVKVQGRGRFPIDMLRRDALHPLTEEDSNTIQQSFEEVQRDNWTINLVGQTSRAPWLTVTEARWNSYGWDVVSVEGE